MFGLNPGNVTRQIHDNILTRWVYETNDSVEEILGSENYLVYLNHSPEKIHPGDEILIRSQTVSGEFKMLCCYVGYDVADESFFPIYTQVIDIYTGKVEILAGLEDYIEEEDDDGDES